MNNRFAFCCVVCTSAGLAVSAGVARGDQPVTALRIDADLSKGLAQQCRYSASIHGTVLPAAGNPTGGGGQAPPVNPNLNVQASLSCPNLEAVTINDSVMATGPLTRDQLVQALERRGTIITARPSNQKPGPSKRCVYAPELSLQGSDVKLVNVDVSCKP